MVGVLILAVIGLIWVVVSRTQEQGGSGEKGVGSPPAPVEVAEIRRGPIELRRTFSGTLEAPAKFVVAPKISGRIARLAADLGDTVRRGQVVAELDDDEYVQAVAQAKADLAVARANLAEAKSALEIAIRDSKRVETLFKRGVASESQFDAAQNNHLAKQSQLEVAEAQVVRAQASLETANIRLGYTKINADWSGGDDHRVVAERHVDEGGTVSANAPLLSIVELNPITGVIFVTEKDYVRLGQGQPASLTTDAFPGERFEGRINRIAPVFQQNTRQARVEMTIQNQRDRLKPGMFIRATIILGRIAEATIVPEKALTTRGNRTGVFVVHENDQTVVWREVNVGIREGERVQVEGEGLSGKVVTLGQQLVDDGSPVSIAAELNRNNPSGKGPGSE